MKAILIFDLKANEAQKKTVKSFLLEFAKAFKESSPSCNSVECIVISEETIFTDTVLNEVRKLKQ